MEYEHAAVSHKPLARTAAAVALLLLTVAMGITAARAASLGKLEMVSRLGQPFHARIEVLSASRHELDTLGARLASAEAYRQAGLAYAAPLQSLRFNLARRQGGQHYIEVRSAHALREPVVDLLIELAWFQGTRSYGYTALVDPAGYGTTASAIAPLAYRSTTAAVAGASVAQPAAKPARPPAVRAAAAGAGDSLATRIRQKEAQLATYKHRFAAAEERITELQWTAQEQEQLLSAMAAETIVTDMRGAAAPAIVRVSTTPGKPDVAGPPPGITDTLAEPRYLAGGAAAMLLVILAVARARRRSVGEEDYSAVAPTLQPAASAS